jgi:hypothetical protein
MVTHVDRVPIPDADEFLSMHQRDVGRGSVPDGFPHTTVSGSRKSIT